jgi:hypothetical protein
MFASILLSLALLGDTIKPAASNLNIIQLYTRDYCTEFVEPTLDTVITYTLIPSDPSVALYFGYSSSNCIGGIQISNIVLRSPNGDIIYTGYIYDGLVAGQTYEVSVSVTTTGACAGIDNLCPYYLVINPLAVELCGYTIGFNTQVHCQFIICSATATRRFLVDKSTDLLNWSRVCEISAESYSSTARTYEFNDDKYYAGISYYKVTEEDLNGNLELVFIDYAVAPEIVEGTKRYYDLSGRLIKIK